MSAVDIHHLGEAIIALKRVNLKGRGEYDPVRLQVEVALEACRRAQSKLQAELALQGVEVIE